MHKSKQPNPSFETIGVSEWMPGTVLELIFLIIFNFLLVFTFRPCFWMKPRLWLFFILKYFDTRYKVFFLAEKVMDVRHWWMMKHVSGMSTSLMAGEQSLHIYR